MATLGRIIGKENAEALVDGSSTTLEWLCEDELDKWYGRVSSTKDKLGEDGIAALTALFPVRLRVPH